MIITVKSKQLLSDKFVLISNYSHFFTTEESCTQVTGICLVPDTWFSVQAALVIRIRRIVH